MVKESPRPICPLSAGLLLISVPLLLPTKSPKSLGQDQSLCRLRHQHHSGGHSGVISLSGDCLVDSGQSRDAFILSPQNYWRQRQRHIHMERMAWEGLRWLGPCLRNPDRKRSSKAHPDGIPKLFPQTVLGRLLKLRVKLERGS